MITTEALRCWVIRARDNRIWLFQVGSYGFIIEPTSRRSNRFTVSFYRKDFCQNIFEQVWNSFAEGRREPIHEADMPSDALEQIKEILDGEPDAYDPDVLYQWLESNFPAFFQ